MKNATVHRAPVLSAVWKEQFSITGLSIRREAALAALALGFICVAGVMLNRIPALAALVDNGLAGFRLDPGEPGFGLMGVFAALLFPLSVWKGERPWGDTPMWSLPVDHRRHALTKVAAGWVWLMALLSLALLCIVLAVLAGGGILGADEVRLLITDEAGFFAGAAGATQEVAWTTPWWEWVMPFTSATAAYLVVSALLLGTAYPIRWAVAIYLMSYLPLVAVVLFDLDGLMRDFEFVAWSVGAEQFTHSVWPTDGERIRGWYVLPSVGMWVSSASAWIGLGVACVLGAVARIRDH